MLLLLLLLLGRRNTTGASHVINCHLIVRHGAGGIQGDAQRRCAAHRWYVRLSPGKCARLGLVRRGSGRSRRLCSLLLLYMLLLQLLLCDMRPRLRAWASSASSNSSKALFDVLLVGTLGSLRSLDARTRCYRVLAG